MKIRIRYTSGRLAEMYLDFPMHEPLDSILIEVSRKYGALSWLPVLVVGSPSPSETLEYRLAGYLNGQPEVPCYRFIGVLETQQS